MKAPTNACGFPSQVNLPAQSSKVLIKESARNSGITLSPPGEKKNIKYWKPRRDSYPYRFAYVFHRVCPVCCFTIFYNLWK